MRRYLLIIVLLLFCAGAYSQKKGGPGGKGMHSLRSIFAQKDRKHAKYFIGLSYGWGQAWWNSLVGQAEIYDAFGTVIKSGTIDFKAKNSTNSVCLDGSVPVGRVRVGLGINFDYYFLDKLELVEAGKSPQYVLYPESFRFDKFFAMVEVPFNFDSDRFWTLNLRAHIGYFNFSYVDHFSLFGDDALAKTFYSSIGLVSDFKLYPHTYLFAHPNFEFKYYDNNNSENPIEIRHKIAAWNLPLGIRIDCSKEK